jgi:hypothetical protein
MTTTIEASLGKEPAETKRQIAPLPERGENKQTESEINLACFVLLLKSVSDLEFNTSKWQ